MLFYHHKELVHHIVKQEEMKREELDVEKVAEWIEKKIQEEQEKPFEEDGRIGDKKMIKVDTAATAFNGHFMNFFNDVRLTLKEELLSAHQSCIQIVMEEKGVFFYSPFCVSLYAIHLRILFSVYQYTSYPE